MSRVIIRATISAPANDWLDHMSDLFDYVCSQCVGDVSTCPALSVGFVDWFFENRCDAVWFMLKYSGEEVTYEYDKYEQT